MKRIIVTTLIAFLFACSSDNEEDLFPAPTPITDSTEITFQNDIEPLFRQNCTNPGCHVPRGPGGFVLLTNYDQIKLQIDNGAVERRVIMERTMPQGGPLPQAEISLLKAWIDRGALNN